MTAIVLLFITGALLLAAEVLLPGAIAGILGGATVAALLLVGGMLYAELVWLPRTKIGRGMVVESTISGQSQPMPATSEVVGQSATALTMLAPSGFIEVAGKRYEAFCRTGLVPRGTQLTVVGVDNFRLIVSENKTHE